MNVKPGDLARIIGNHVVNPNTADKLCDVLYAVKPGMNILPDGSGSVVTSVNAWCIKLLSPIDVMWADGSMREALYAVCPDSRLRPIRGQEGQDETLTWCDVPDEVTA